MTRVEDYKNKLGAKSGEAKFIDEYIEEIKSLFSELDSRGALIKTHTGDKVKRIQKFVTSSNASGTLLNNGYKLFDIDKEKTKNNIGKLKDSGYKVDNIADQFASIMCHSIQVSTERLKLHFVTLIDFSKLSLEDADKKPLGACLHCLKRDFGSNRFVQSLDTKIRNAVTHYTYFIQNAKVVLCDGYFDPTPTEMTLAEFMIESKKASVLTEIFFLCYLDQYCGEGELNLDM